MPTSTHCDVAVMDDPLNFKTIYDNRGQSLPQRLPAGTHPMCDYYDSQEYVGQGKVRSRALFTGYLTCDAFLFPLSPSLFIALCLLLLLFQFFIRLMLARREQRTTMLTSDFHRSFFVYTDAGHLLHWHICGQGDLPSAHTAH